MTKQDVLAIFANSGGFLKPDEARKRLRTSLDRRSFYSYLLRLARQGLLRVRRGNRRGHLAYCLTERGQARLEYFRR
jgi:DNA-binding PadR family transcriptional regulator